MTTDKRISDTWNGSNFVDSDSSLRHARKYNPANPGDAPVYAPDAEALAVAMENLLNLAQSWQVDFEEMANNPEYKAVYTWETKNAQAVLRAYRAAHPVTR